MHGAILTLMISIVFCQDGFELRASKGPRGVQESTEMQITVLLINEDIDKRERLETSVGRSRLLEGMNFF